MTPNNDASVLFFCETKHMLYNPNWARTLPSVVSASQVCAALIIPNSHLQNKNDSLFKHKMIENGQSKTKSKD